MYLKATSSLKAKQEYTAASHSVDDCECQKSKHKVGDRNGQRCSDGRSKSNQGEYGSAEVHERIEARKLLQSLKSCSNS
ncbi:hypothetical protein KCU87_g106, partial [Aureobasidium melanogenum]